MRLPRTPALRIAATALSIAGLLTIGCSSEGLLPAGGITRDPSLLATAGSAGGDPPGFGPFASQPESTSGGRDVIQNPTIADVMLTSGLPEMSWGRPDAPVTLIKYMSLTCPYCRRFQLETFPQLKREYIDTGKVRFIIREFPIGKSSGTATIALRCTSPDKYLTLYEKFLSQQAAWVSQEVRTDAIYKIASQVGMSRDQFDSCLQNRGMIASLNWVKERGRKLGVIGTPNFFLNGRLIKSVVGMKEIREMVDPIIAGRITDAGTAVH
jgi:protein-disulfide isomerase